MVLRKRISYQWRLFIPLVITLWGIILGMAAWQVYRVQMVRRDMVFDQLKVVGERISNAYSSDVDPIPFIRFIGRFYDENEHYDDIRVLVYDTSVWELIYDSGGPQFDIRSIHDRIGIISDPELGDTADGDLHKYLYYVTDGPDGNLRIYVMLPYTKKLAQLTNRQTTTFWIILCSLGILVTVFSYLSTRYLGQNIRLLRNFAERANTDPSFVSVGEDVFPHDELGDISRQIMSMYNQRSTAMLKREKEHKIAINAMEEKSRLKRELTGNINHELKTPIGIIKGYLDTIVDNPDMDPETRDHFLHKAQDNVNRLVNLIADITAITRLESGTGEKLINVDEVNFHDLVFSHASDVEETGLIGGMTFNYEIPFNCCVLGNGSLLTGMLLNLTKNAVAYSQGTECGIMCTGEDDDFYYFSFYDDGVGVAPEHIPHLFDRFYRVNSGRSRQSGGTGLGLPIVQVTVLSHGGSIEVMNRMPHGLEFRFSLPKVKSKKRNDS